MKTQTGIILGCAGSAFVAVVVVSLALGFFFAHVAKDPDGLQLTADAPDAVQVGDTFQLVVKATNETLDRELELGDLDIADAYLRGFAIVSVNPDPKSTYIDTFNDCTSTRFAAKLPPGKSAEFEFELRAERAGRYRGQIDQFVGMQFLSTVVQTTVDR